MRTGTGNAGCNGNGTVPIALRHRRDAAAYRRRKTATPGYDPPPRIGLPGVSIAIHPLYNESWSLDMTTKQRNRYIMYLTVRDWLKKNAARVEHLPAFADIIREYDDLVRGIEQAVDLQGTSSLGKASRKEEMLDLLLQRLFPVSSVLNVVSQAKALEPVKTLTAVSEWRLRHLRDSEIVERADQIHRAAMECAAELEPYGIDAAQLEVLKAAIETYRSSLEDKELGVVSRMGARTSIASLIADAGELLDERLDRMMELFDESDPSFYEEYFGARIVRDLGVRHDVPAAPPSPDTPSTPPASNLQAA